MTHDIDLRVALEGAGAGFDPAFRVRVLQQICARAQRRATAWRVATWVASGIAMGLLARLLTPAASGAPGLEAVAMMASLAMAVFLLAEFATAGTDRVVERLQRILTR